jgi:predicted nucleic acid-binding protein
VILVVDACVAVKWYVGEPLSDEAQLLLEGDALLLAPGNVVAEVGHVLVRRMREGSIGKNHAEAALQGLTKTLTLVPLDELWEGALSLASETSVSFYDALYVAAALRWNARVVTADERLVRALAQTSWADRVASLSAFAVKQQVQGPS